MWVPFIMKNNKSSYKNGKVKVYTIKDRDGEVLFSGTSKEAVRKGISLAGDLYKNMSMLSDALDVKYNVTDADLYQYAYQMVIDDFKKVDLYKNIQESPSARNMNTNKNLAKDCE